jgi:hypothetical protein
MLQFAPSEMRKDSWCILQSRVNGGQTTLGQLEWDKLKVELTHAINKFGAFDS